MIVQQDVQDSPPGSPRPSIRCAKGQAHFLETSGQACLTLATQAQLPVHSLHKWVHSQGVFAWRGIWKQSLFPTHVLLLSYWAIPTSVEAYQIRSALRTVCPLTSGHLEHARSGDLQQILTARQGSTHT